MKRVVVMAFEDRSRPEGGHAMLVLGGVNRMPEPQNFELRLIDSEDLNGLIGHDLEPVSARLTDDGLELIIGPDLTEAPELTAGTAVELTVRSIGVKGEFLWPDVAPMARPKRRMRVVRSQPVPRAITGGAAEPADSDQSHGFDGVADNVAAEARMPRPSVPAAAARTASGTAPDVSRSPASGGDGAAVPRPTAASQLIDVMPSGPRPPGRVAGPGEERPTAPVGAVQQGTLPPVGGSWAGFAGIVVAGMLAVQGLVWVTLGGGQGLVGGLSTGATAGPAAPRAATMIATAAPDTELFDLLAVGPRSPRGVDAASVDASRALAMAAESLQGNGGRRDTAEGGFWVRHYLMRRIGEPATVRALTQLGSAHAEPSNGPVDYAKAHRLWQIAAAYGDPVAMCFLGALHANGLGVPVDKATAERWQATAAAKGGC